VVLLLLLLLLLLLISLLYVFERLIGEVDDVEDWDLAAIRKDGQTVRGVALQPGYHRHPSPFLTSRAYSVPYRCPGTKLTAVDTDTAQRERTRRTRGGCGYSCAGLSSGLRLSPCVNLDLGGCGRRNVAITIKEE